MGAGALRRSEEETAAFSLLASRVATSAERIATGRRVTQEDLSILQTMSERLRAQTEAVSGKQSAGGIDEPKNAVAAGLTVDVVLHDEGTDEPSDEEIAAILKKIAAALDELPTTTEPDQARALAGLFRRISAFARSNSGVLGEQVIGRHREHV